MLGLGKEKRQISWKLDVTDRLDVLDVLEAQQQKIDNSEGFSADFVVENKKLFIVIE